MVRSATTTGLLLRLVGVLGATCAQRVTITPPNPPPTEEEKRRVSVVEKKAVGIMKFTMQFSYMFAGVAEIALIVVRPPRISWVRPGWHRDVHSYIVLPDTWTTIHVRVRNSSKSQTDHFWPICPRAAPLIHGRYVLACWHYARLRHARVHDVPLPYWI